MMRVAVIGSGYVGLVSATCLAVKGHQVVCVDQDAAKVEAINAGQPPIHEDGLAGLLASVVGTRLTATTDLRTAVIDADLSLIAVGTPFNGEEIDLGYIKTAAAQIGEALRDRAGYHAVVVKSTVVPGTTDDVVKGIIEQTAGKCAGRDFGLGMNPEFLREGVAIQDFMQPDRIVIGGIDARTREAIAGLYRVFPGVEQVLVDNRSAELIKYSANALLATLISFSNEMSRLASAAGVDIVDIMHGVHLDKRLSPLLPDGTRVQPGLLTYLAAGCGFGGSCFPKDVKAAIAYGQQHGLDMPLLKAVVAVNDSQPDEMISRLTSHYPLNSDLRIGIIGIAFKPGTDDIRESPSLPVIARLLAQGVKVSLYDPIAAVAAREKLGGQIDYAGSLRDLLHGQDAILVMTAWPECAALPALVAELAAPPLVIDGRRVISPTSVPRYEAIGRAIIPKSYSPPDKGTHHES